MLNRHSKNCHSLISQLKSLRSAHVSCVVAKDVVEPDVGGENHNKFTSFKSHQFNQMGIIDDHNEKPKLVKYR